MKLRANIYKNWVKSRNSSFLKLLEPNPDAKVVDLGCGDGDFSLKVKKKIGCSKIYGVDVFDPYIREAKMKGIDVIKHDLNDFPYPFENNTFDVVISSQVIEHLFYPVKFLKEVYRILKPGGYAVISTENLASWDNIFSLILGYTPFSMEFDSGLYKIGNPLSLHNKETIDPNLPPHVRILSFRGLVDLTSFISFKLEKIIGSGHILGKIGEIIDKIHCRFIMIKVRK